MATKRRTKSGTKTKRKSKSPVKPKPASRAKTRRGKKTTARKPAVRKTTRAATSRRPARRISSISRAGSTRGLGPEAAGQAGDTEGLSRAELADSESVEELVEEGQAFEAGIVSGVENAPDADRGGVRTRQVPEDDVPQEYLDED